MGWIAIGLVVFAAWRPFRLLLGAYVFGLAVRTNFTLQALGFEEIPAEVLKMMPFILTIAALFILAEATCAGASALRLHWEFPTHGRRGNAVPLWGTTARILLVEPALDRRQHLFRCDG